MAIARQSVAEGDAGANLETYFRLLAAQVKDRLGDAPEELKRDLADAIRQVIKAGEDAIAGVPADLQQRLAVTSGGQMLFLLDQARDGIVRNTSALESLLDGVGIYSRSVTKLGEAFYINFDGSSAYAFIRETVENILEVMTAPNREIVEWLRGRFERG